MKQYKLQIDEKFPFYSLIVFSWNLYWTNPSNNSYIKKNTWSKLASPPKNLTVDNLRLQYCIKKYIKK